MIGAATAKAPPVPEQPPTAVAGTPLLEPRYTATRDYWATLLVLCTLVVPLIMFGLGRGVRNWEPIEWGIVYAMIFPAIQLFASVAVALAYAASVRPGKRERAIHLGRITLRTFIGGVIGIVVMILLSAVLE